MPRSTPRRANADHVLITQRERMFAHLLLKGEHSDQKCAELAGFPANHAPRLKKRRQVKEYIEIYNQQLMMMMLNREMESMVAQGITREALVQRLWIIANTASERTRDSYESQIEAIDKIAGILGFKIQPRDMDELFRGKSDEQIANYMTYGSFDRPVTQ
ncbi:MAG: hypothetical protein ACJ71S_06065 [Acidobacteriaceae bacterium]